MVDITKSKTAIIMLACRDYESMEVALACHMRFGDPEVPFFVLQNCFGGYDAERTLQVARRYEGLYWGRVRVIDDLGEASPYHNIKRLLERPELEPYSHILKVDDDAFPIAEGWLDSLIDCWRASEKEHGDQLAYVTPLINNNTWGFKRTIEILGLEDEYFGSVARPHRVGSGDSQNPFRILPADEISTGANGTIWASPHVARWLHERTTLDPDRMIAGCKGQGRALIPSEDRYSIGAILFRKELWAKIDDNGRDDEHMFHQYCKRNNSVIVCEQTIPFVHFAYFSQRAENRDIVPKAREVYQRHTGLPFPIAACQDRLLEIEARLRWLENQQIQSQAPNAMSRTGAAEGASQSKHHLGKAAEIALQTGLYKVGLRKKPPRQYRA